MLLRRPAWQLLLSLLLLTALAAGLLAYVEQSHRSGREAEYFWAYFYWRCAFDSLSAVCGAGLRITAPDPYSSAGEWLLTAFGLAGAAAYVLATWRCLALAGPSLTIWRTPGPWLPLALLAGWQILATACIWLAEWSAAPAASTATPADAVRTALAAAASLGAVHPEVAARQSALLAVIAWITALGWTIWIALWLPVGRVLIRLRPALALAGGYSALLILIALLVFSAEAPRSGVGESRGPTLDGQTLSQSTPGDRFLRGLRQTATAAGAGIALEPLHDREVSELTRMLLGLTLLLGGVGASPAGGCGALLLLWAVVALVANAETAGKPVARWSRAGVTCLAGLLMLAILAALGLQFIEGFSGSRFETPPTFSAAFLEAASAVGGGALSTGLTESVTSPRLIRGLGLPIDLYQVGMVWLMLFMLLGRVWPIICLARIGEDADGDGRTHGFGP